MPAVKKFISNNHRQSTRKGQSSSMAQQRMAIWAAEDIDEDLQDVDLSLAIGNYGQNGHFDDGLSFSRLSVDRYSSWESIF